MSLSLDAIDRMRKIIGGDEEALAEILQSFVDEAGSLVDTLVTAAKDGRFDTLGRAAHTIKASARDFGDDELASLCADIEQRSKQGIVADAVAASQLAATGCIALKHELMAYLGSNLRGEVL